MVTDVVRDILVNELLPKYMPANSILPSKLSPVQADGSKATDGMQATYRDDPGYVVFE